MEFPILPPLTWTEMKHLPIFERKHSTYTIALDPYKQVCGAFFRLFRIALTEPEDIQFVEQVHRAYPDFPLLRTFALLKEVNSSDKL